MLHIAFVSSSKNPQRFRDDPAFTYRCENLALALTQLGHKATLTHYRNLDTSIRYDAIVFHRPAYRKLFDGITFPQKLKRMQRKGTKLIADFDDLVFDPQYANSSPGVINQSVSIAQTEKNFRHHLLPLQHFDAVSVSTLPLVEKVHAVVTSAKVHWMPNTPHLSWFQQKPAAATKPSDHLVLTYYPGTNSHNRDFASIQAPLEQVLAENPHVQLHITGVLDTRITCAPHQLHKTAKIPFADYWQAVQFGHINLAPLELTEFNQHKSGLKGIESSFWNKPTYASRIPDMERLQGCGVHCVNTPSEWYSALTHAVTQYKPQSLREKLLAIANGEQECKRWLNFLGLVN